METKILKKYAQSVEMISTKQAILQALEKNQTTRANTKFARNLLVVETLRLLEVPIVISYKDFPKFSFDAICTEIRQVRASPEGRLFFDDFKDKPSKKSQEEIAAEIERANPNIRFERPSIKID